ncbi:MAG: DUF3857 domain-containing protein [Verrucomicrobiae bacterium]|nr:DUF3857 domain-containing protein [Verrucomicrobiae bacterium]
MNRNYKLIILTILVGFLVTGDGFGKPPTWFKNLRPKVLPEFALNEDPEAIMLRNDRTSEISSGGTFTTTISQAILIRKQEGFESAVGRIPYNNDTDKILSFKAWTLSAEGKVHEFKKDEFADTISFMSKNIVTTSRTRSINASRNVRAGSIFAYEAVVENKDIFSQDVWFFQGPFPTLNSSTSYEFPEGWNIKPVFFNMEAIDPIETRLKRSTRLTWTLSSIPGLKLQPYSPAPSELTQWMAIDIIPPEGSHRRYYRSWQEISANLTPEYDALTLISPEMQEKVEALTSSSTTKLETIRTLSELAQKVTYISVALDVGKGGGYRPRPSDEVYSTNYGDCKDKTNYLQSLLKIKGIEMYPLLVYSGKNKIFDNWPSPSQFNHCIAAIKVEDDFSSPAVIDHETLGRLLVFDPTSTFTPFGDIPHTLQGSKGVVLAGDKGGLVSIPELPLETSLVKRQIEINMLPDGRAFGLLKETTTGQSGRNERRAAFTKDSDYLQIIKDWVNSYHPGAIISEPQTNDDMENGNFHLEFEFGIPSFSKNMRNVLLIFKPLLVNRISSHPFGEDERTLDVDLYPYNLDEKILINLPEGFEISELPEDVSVETDFASFHLNFEHSEKTIQVNRTIQLQPLRIPLDRYGELTDYFEKRIKADQSTVVLERP